MCKFMDINNNKKITKKHFLIIKAEDKFDEHAL